MRTKKMNKLTAFFTLLFLFTSFAITVADDTTGSPDPKTFLGAFESINDVIRRQNDPEFQETLKNFETLLSGKDILGQTGILGNAVFAAPSSGSIYSAINNSNDIQNGVENQVDTFGESTWSLADAVDKKDGSQNLRRKIRKVNSANCVADIQRLVTNVTQNQWTLPFLDAWGKPGPSILQGRLNFVGNYRQCRNAKAPPQPGVGGTGFTGNYCVLSLAAKNASGSSPLAALTGNAVVQIGSCVPDSCSQDELSLLVNLGLTMLNMSETFVAMPTECRTDEREFTSATVAAIVILSLILVLMICGTLFDLLVIQRPKWNTRRQGVDSPDYDAGRGILPRSSYHPILDEETTTGSPTSRQEQTPMNAEVRNGSGPVFLNEKQPLLGKSQTKSGSCSGILSQILLSFSVYTNASKVLNASQPPGSLSAINGIRCLSMSWVVLGHMFVFGLANVSNVAEEYPLLLKRWTFDAISNALVSVDTFFTLSGLLVAYLTTKEMSKKGWKINWGLFYFHRFWRLTPPYMLTLLIVLGLQRFMGSGALWSTVQPADKEICEENWWTNLLYVNNLVNKDKMCFGHAWYLANDMQFYILSPLMLIPFVFNRYAGFISCSIFLLAQWITAGVLSTDNEWGSSTLGTGIMPKPGSLDYMGYYYIAPYCRIGPYVIGILAGYILAVSKGRVQMNKITVVIGWTVSIASALAIVYGLRGDLGGGNPSSLGAAALYNAVARSAWGVCVCWVIIACSSGYGGPVNTMLSWSPFVALGRLTYMAYLIHPCIMYVYFGNQESLYLLNDTNIVISYLGILLFTYLASFILMLALESPWIGLEKALLRNKRH